MWGKESRRIDESHEGGKAQLYMSKIVSKFYCFFKVEGTGKRHKSPLTVAGHLLPDTALRAVIH